MPKFTATCDYRSQDNGRTFVFVEGETVDLDEDRAAWVNRDSPGTLEPAGKTPAKTDPAPEVCAGTTAAGDPCSKPAGPDGFCHLHSEDA